jgi:hypothetical protein
MKKTIFASLLLMATSAVFAQANINKGDWMLGGKASFSSSKLSGFPGTSTSIEISPNAGYFFANNFAGGLNFSLQSTSETGSDAVTAYAIAPFIRYYFLPSTQKVNVFAEAAGGIGSASSGGNSASMNLFQISAGPAIFLAPNVALEVALAYSSVGGDMYNYMDESHRFNSFGMNVGFQIHLAGKK